MQHQLSLFYESVTCYIVLNNIPSVLIYINLTKVIYLIYLDILIFKYIILIKLIDILKWKKYLNILIFKYITLIRLTDILK